MPVFIASYFPPRAIVARAPVFSGFPDFPDFQHGPRTS
jgi:hypothetical protein